MEFTAWLMQYIGGDLDPGFSWDCGFGCSSGGSSGEAIWEGEPTVLAWVDVYLLNSVINRARGAASIGGCRGLVDWP